MNLIHDDGLDPQKRFSGRTRQHQIEGFWGRDEDVGRKPRQQPTILGGGVTGAHTDGHVVCHTTEPLGGLSHTNQWCAQVAFDVHAERFQR